ncbi:MAG: riboflavin synthase [bacterium]|nr:riboflavin synthase [bacterium]
MFTGLIQALGHVDQVTGLEGGLEMTISCPDGFLSGVNEGDSIAINGACGTALGITSHVFNVKWLPETLAKTTFDEIEPGARVNLEKSLKVGDALGGHYVTGHVDGAGMVLDWQHAGEFGELIIAAPEALLPYLVEKGSVAIDGISLTVVGVLDTVNERFDAPQGWGQFTCFIIPHTRDSTSLGFKNGGDRVNLEGDILGKYVARQLSRTTSKGG